MFGRRSMVKGLGAALGVATAGLPRRASATEVLKIGTLYPKSSPWGQVCTMFAKAVKDKSGGNLEVQFLFNGETGDEGAMVAKMKSAQLDGALISSVGLGKIYKPILALQMPGLFTTWAKLDTARDALTGEFDQGLRDAGFTLTGWHDQGLLFAFSKGFAVRPPTDIKGKKPWMWRDDAIAPIVYQAIGGVSPVPLNIPEVLPNLVTGATNIVLHPALMAEQLQWSSKLDHVVDAPFAAIVGGTVFATKRLDALPEDLRSILIDTAKVASASLTTRIRSEDKGSLARIKGKMTVTTLSPDEKIKWDDLFKQVRQKLSQGTFSPDLVAKLEAMAG